MIDAVAFVCRHLHTPISEVEDMDWDRFGLYMHALVRVLEAEMPKG